MLSMETYFTHDTLQYMFFLDSFNCDVDVSKTFSPLIF